MSLELVPPPTQDEDIDIEQAQQAMEDSLAVNLDEITSDEITVRIREYKLEGGKRIKHERTATLDTFVPMRVFNKMLASREKTLKKRAEFLSGKLELDEDPMVTWMVEQVANVWKLSEPDMTTDKLQDGLKFTQIQKLFTLFFGDLIQKKEPNQKGA